MIRAVTAGRLIGLSVCRMATILLTYEFGAGLGHLPPLIAVAERLAETNRLVFALPDLALGTPVLRRAFGDRVEILQGPFWPASVDPELRRTGTDTLADVFRMFYFHQMDRLVEMAKRWIDILRQVSPQLIVADFAPTLRLANSGRVSTVVVGNGYTVPPPGSPLPPLRPWKKTAPAESRFHEEQMLDAVNGAAAKLSRPAVEVFADLFQGEKTFVCTLAEFDPYRAWRDTALSWPLDISAIAKGPDFAARRGAAAFCYLSAKHPALSTVLAAISALGRPAGIYVQGADPREIASRCSSNVEVHEKPADFARQLPEASLLLHHSGLGTANAGLAAGVPQLVFPLNLEQLITARGLQTFKVGGFVTPPLPTGAKLAAVLDALLCDSARQSASLAAADEIAARCAGDPVGPVVAACEALM